jgi:hypothetical protein
MLCQGAMLDVALQLTPRLIWIKCEVGREVGVSEQPIFSFRRIGACPWFILLLRTRQNGEEDSGGGGVSFGKACGGVVVMRMSPLRSREMRPGLAAIGTMRKLTHRNDKFLFCEEWVVENSDALKLECCFTPHLHSSSKPFRPTFHHIPTLDRQPPPTRNESAPSYRRMIKYAAQQNQLHTERNRSLQCIWWDQKSPPKMIRTPSERQS